MNKTILFCIIAVLILGNFNFINIAADQEESNVLLEEISCLSEEKKFGNGRLEQSIVCLLSDYKGENGFKSLQTKDLTFVDNKVRLEIILSEEDKLDALKGFDENIEVENHYKSLVQVLVPIDIIEQLSEETFVNYIRRPIECQPLVTSEGVGVIGADLVHADGYYGDGVKVAVIDLGFEDYDVNPDIPPERIVEAISYRAGYGIKDGGIHGSACAELVLDVAPHTDLYLYSCGTISEFDAAVNRAILQDVDIISFSLGWTGINDYDGSGDVCDIVNDARSSGILFITSAGNSADHHYEGYFKDNDGDDFHEFGITDEGLSLGYLFSSTYIDFTLTWDDWPDSNQDYDLFLFRGSSILVAYSINLQTGSQPPFESISGYTIYSDNYYVVISRYSSTRNVHFELYGGDYTPFIEYNHPESSLTCPADAYGATTVGATYYGNDAIESFSSQGPTNDGRTKPDVTAPDGVTTNAYGSGNFYGTSASAPHTAGAAALLLSIAPGLTVDELESKLETTALDLGTAGKDNVFGSGRIDVWNTYRYIVPSVDFSYAPLNPNTTTSIQFIDSSSDSDGSIASWLWNFDDGNTATDQNPTHQYSDNQTYTVTLTITDDNGATNTTSKQIIVTNIDPTANFTYIPVNPTDIDTISFSDTSTDIDGTIESWYWEFGDGNTSTDQNSTHQYVDNGTYDVTLNVTDDDSATDEITRQITIQNVAPVASFSYLPTQPTDLELISFTDTSTDSDGTITSYSWDFGDGNTSTDQNPTHQYSGDDVYSVTLNVTDDDGATNETTKIITVSNVIPTIDFVYQPLKPNVNQTITFTDRSSDPDGTISSWSWDFGDGNTSTNQHPTHAYIFNGSYNVTLTVTDDDGDTNRSSTQVTVYWSPNANFTWEPQYPLIDETVYFNDTSIDYDGSIVSWSWEFGDGNTSTDQNTTHSYTIAGTYLVTLNVTDDSSLYVAMSKNIIINDPPEANFTYSPLNPKTENVVTFNDTTVDNYGEVNNWSWDFGDGNVSYVRNTTNTYGDNGTYTVRLTVTDNCTATDMKTKEICILNTPPHVEFTYDPSAPTDIDNITFNDNSSDIDGTIVNWTWDFGDGNGSYRQNPTYQYADNGTYDVTLNVTDDDGDTNETSIELLVENVAPTVDFSYSPKTPLANELITFNATGVDVDGSIVNWSWDFGDGNTSFTQNTTRSYSIFNSYYVNLTVRDNDGDTSFVNKTIVMKNMTTNQTNEGIVTTINLTEQFDMIVELNTTNATRVNISRYSGNPSNVNTSSVYSIGKYYEIIIKNESDVNWPINITIFYKRSELDNVSLNESQLLGIYFWNDTAENWELCNKTGVNTINQSGYDGYMWAQAWHLTNITPGGDNVNPGNVTGLTVTDAKNGKLDLSWNAASDNTGIAHYRIYCDKKSTINTSDNSTTYQYTDLTDGTTYTFNVSAVDIAGNEGNQSASVNGTSTKKSSGGNGGGGLPPGPTNLQPNADAGGPYTGYTGIPVGFDGSASNDSDGNISKFKWNFGDDSTETGMTPNHIYSNIGNYTVILAVTDDKGATAEDETYILINNLPPETPTIHGPKTGKKNITCTYTINSSDPNNDTIRYVINWGDSTNITVTDFTDNNAPVNITHTWSAFGIYTVDAYAKDENNGTSENTSLTVLIDIMFCNESGYLIDTDSDEIYDFFYSNETGKQTLTILEKQNYLIDRDGDGKWDYKYDETMGVKPYQEKEENGTPGFGLIPILLAATLVLFWKRKRK